MDKITYLGETLFRWQVGGSTYIAHPERGARLMNWSLELGDGTVRDVIHWPEIKTFEGFAKVRGGNPILFPFSARTFDRGDGGFWRDMKGVRRPMPMHGFARQGAFRTTRLDDDGFDAVLVPSDEARAAYPFAYEFTVSYRFGPLGLVCKLELENTGDEPLPWCAGHHFYFALPWTEGFTRAHYHVDIDAGRRLRQDPLGQLVEGPALGRTERMDNLVLVDTIHTDLRKPIAVFGERGAPGDVTVRIGDGRTVPAGSTFVTWTQDDAAPYYCVEPWMGPPNAPEHGIGLAQVPPGRRQAFTVAVDVG
jgi:galactose mutarotase-like enzyme